MNIKSSKNIITLIAIFSIGGLILLAIVRAGSDIVAVDSSQFTLAGGATERLDQTASNGSFSYFSDTTDTKSRGIVVFGDSLLQQQSAYLRLQQKLESRSWSNIHMSAQGCRPTAHLSQCGGPPGILGLDQILEQIKASNYPNPNDPNNAGLTTVGDLNVGLRQASTVIVALGTNDMPRDSASMEQKARRAVGLIREINPGIHIYWTRNCNVTPAIRDAANAMNAAIDNIKTELNIIHIDWLGSCRPEWIHDGTHYIAEGADAYAETMAAGVEP